MNIENKKMTTNDNDIVNILEIKAHIMRNKYAPIVDGREILLNAAEEIKSLRTRLAEATTELNRVETVRALG